MRAKDEKGVYDNKVSAMFAELPVGIGDPVERLEAIHAQMQDLKSSGQAVAAERLTALGGFAPALLLALAGRIGTRLPQGAINTVTTNVPGPQQPLYLAGARMLEAFPFVPLGGHVRIGIAIFSYDGGINFGVTGDFDTARDINVLCANGPRLAGEKRMQAQSGSDGDTDAGRGQEAQQRADQVVPGEPLVRECGEAGDRFGGDHDGRGVGGAGEDEPVQERWLEPAW